MNPSLIIAILFTAAAAIWLFNRKAQWWLPMLLVFVAGAAINWLRYFEVIRG